MSMNIKVGDFIMISRNSVIGGLYRANMLANKNYKIIRITKNDNEYIIIDEFGEEFPLSKTFRYIYNDNLSYFTIDYLRRKKLESIL